MPGIRRRIAGESRRRRVVGAVAAIGAVVIALGVLVSAGLPGSSRGATAQRTGSGSTTVERRDLIATDTVAGTLSYAKPQTVFNRMSGTITAMPTVGAVVRPGGTLYRVDGAPIVLFDGTVPAYRTLTSGVTDGPDVQELKQNLVNLGFDPSHQITVDQTFDAATVTAIDAWQAALGQTQTGTVTLGQVVFLPGPQRITAVDAVLGSTGGSSGSSGASGASSAASGTTTSSTSYSPVPRTEFVSFTTTPAVSTPAPKAAAARTPPSSTAAASAAPSNSTEAASKGTCPAGHPDPTTTTPPKDSGPASACPKPSSPTAQQLLAQLVAELKKLSSSSSGSSGRSSGTGSGTGSGSASAGASGSSSGRSSGGGGGGAGTSSSLSSGGGGGGSATGTSSSGTASSASGSATPILQTTSTQVIVSVALDATKQSEAVVGEPVTVQLPDGSTADGKVTTVSPVAQSTSSSSSSSTTAGGGGGGSTTPSATIPVTVTLSGHQLTGGLDQAAVSVNFQQQVERNVLSVPVTALLATAGGRYAVQEANAPHSLIPVTPGLFAAGFVQISGAGIYPGLQVTDSQG